ncbi:MAG: ATPase [Flavobacterium sp.]|nr:MAG: ATPase [Flavobacterium sp.]
MEKQHLTYFKIENFKRFDSFEMSNLGQFNLIVGDNNVGKTSVLEGLLYGANRFVENGTYDFIKNLYEAYLYRGGMLPRIDRSLPLNQVEVFLYNFWKFTLKEFYKPLTFFYSLIDGYEYKTTFEIIENLNSEDKEYINQYSHIEFQPESKYWLRATVAGNYEGTYGRYFENAILRWNDYGRKKSLVSIRQGYSDGLVTLYYQVINTSKKLEEMFIATMGSIIPNLEQIRVHQFNYEQDVLAVRLKNDDGTYPLTRFGEGTVKLCRLLLYIVANKKGRVLVDEIETGIHFTRLIEFWKNILLMCSGQEVQLFATTHSLECQQAFIEALQDDDMKQFQEEARNISMIENKKGELKAITYNYSQFEYAMNIGFNTRGGKI